MAQAREPTLDEIEHCMRVLADFIRLHGPNGAFAAPIYERLERERDKLIRFSRALDRALTLSRTGKFQ